MVFTSKIKQLPSDGGHAFTLETASRICPKSFGLLTWLGSDRSRGDLLGARGWEEGQGARADAMPRILATQTLGAAGGHWGLLLGLRPLPGRLGPSPSRHAECAKGLLMPALSSTMTSSPGSACLPQSSRARSLELWLASCGANFKQPQPGCRCQWGPCAGHPHPPESHFCWD